MTNKTKMELEYCFEKNDRIINLISSIKREGINILLKWLQLKDYFIAPASTFYHRSYAGGLAIHSLNVYDLFRSKINQYDIVFNEESIIIVSLLHDLCKTGLYLEENGKYKLNYPILQEGHSKRSLNLINRFIPLTETERDIIKYHMGAYGAHESGCKGTEYSLKEYIDAVNKKPIIALFHECDNQESKWIK